MRRAGCRVFVNACAGREEARDEVVTVGRRARRDDHAAHPCALQQSEVGTDAPHRFFIGNFDQIIILRVPDKLRRNIERAHDLIRRRDQLCHRPRWKIQLDPIAALRCCQQTTARVKMCWCIRSQLPRLPEHVRACERRVPAQVNFDGGREPTQVVSVRARHKERRLR